MLKPKKSLGQHFLRDKNIAKKIVAALGIAPGDRIVEIGPGEGALTGLILDLGAALTAVEIDKRAVGLLAKRFKARDNPNFSLRELDIRDFDYAAEAAVANTAGRIKVIGAIPYNISADIFFLLVESSVYIEKAVLIVQKEVAQRISARPGIKAYGVPSLAMQLVGDAEIAFDVSPESFYPKPAVMSSVLILTFFNKPLAEGNRRRVMDLVKTAFNQRRKTLKNALKPYFALNKGLPPEEAARLRPEAGKTLTPLFAKRAEQLSVEDFIKLEAFLKPIQGE